MLRLLIIIIFILTAIPCFPQHGGYLNIISDGAFVRILGEDSQGRKSGDDPRTNEAYEEIPGIFFDMTGVDSHVEDQEDYTAWEWGFQSTIFNDFEETYKISFIGVKKEHYNIRVSVSNFDNKGSTYKIEGEIDSMEVIEYELFFTTDPTKDFYFKRIETQSNNLHINSIIPSSTYAGNPSFTLYVVGTGFIDGAVVRYNVTDKQTTFISDTLLQAEISAEDIASPDTVLITVINPNNMVSNQDTFIVKENPPGPQVELRDSEGKLLTDGSLQYYERGWKTAENHGDGTFTVDTDRSTISLRMTYAYGSESRSNISTEIEPVVFQTVPVHVELRNSSGILMDEGTIQYYAGAWREFGMTSGGVAVKELLPGNYSFRMVYGFASIDQQQDIGTNPIVVFQTVPAQVELLNSSGELLDEGTVQYYAGAWREFGMTSGGVAVKELLPKNYSFRMGYGFASIDQQQDIASSTTVTFSTVQTTVNVTDTQNQPVNGAEVRYYSGAWRLIGNTANGLVNIELLPKAYTFRASALGASADKQQDISADPAVEIQLNLSN